MKKSKLNGKYSVNPCSIDIDNTDLSKIIADITSDHINGILKHQIFDPDNSDSFMFWSILNPGEIEICLGSTEKQERGVNVIGSLIDMSFDIEDIIFPDEDEGCKECAIKLIKKLRNIADELEKSLPKLKAVK